MRAVTLALLICGSLGFAQVSQQYSIGLDPGRDPDLANSVAVDGAGNTYVLTSVGDVRITKVDARGSVVYSRQIGGSAIDTGSAIAADRAGNVWVAGLTSSADFPVTVPRLAPDPRNPGSLSFMVKLTPSGTVAYSAIIPWFMGIKAIATDAQGNAYVTGTNYGNTYGFTSTPGAFQQGGAGVNAFAIKVSAAGDRILWATSLGGSMPACVVRDNCPRPPTPQFGIGFGLPQEYETGNAIAVDSQGNVYVGGLTDDVDFPVTPGAVQTTCTCEDVRWNGFVTKISADGSHLLYSTYLGASPGTAVQALALTDTGEAWVAGTTAPSGFLAKVKADGSGLLASTSLVPGASVSSVEGLMLNGDSAVTVAATTAYGGGMLLQFDAAASKALFTARLARAQADAGFAGVPGGGFASFGTSGVLTRFDAATPSKPAIYALADSASVTTQAQFAPGELVTLYGANLGPAAGVATTATAGVLPTQAAGTQVVFDGIPGALLYVSADQVNVVVPYEVFGKDRVTVQVVSSSGTASGSWKVVPSSPVVVRDDSGAAIVYNQDGTRNTMDNPAPHGSVATIYASGGGMLVNPAGVNGKINTELAQLELPVSMEFLLSNDRTMNTQIGYAGAAPGQVSGLIQINFVVPIVGAFRLRIGDASSRIASLWVK